MELRQGKLHRPTSIGPDEETTVAALELEVDASEDRLRVRRGERERQVPAVDCEFLSVGRHRNRLVREEGLCKMEREMS